MIYLQNNYNEPFGIQTTLMIYLYHDDNIPELLILITDPLTNFKMLRIDYYLVLYYPL